MRWHVRRAALAGSVLLISCAAALGGADRGRGQIVPGAQPGPLPMLGAADPGMVLMGAAPQGAAGEAWGYRRLPLSVGAVRVGNRSLDLAPLPPGSSEPQLAFVRHTDASGWQVFDTPLDELGNPYRGAVPNRLGARITPEGGGVLVGRDTTRPPADQAVLMHHNPGGAWRVLDAPPPTVLLPADQNNHAEAIAENGGAGPVAIAAVGEGNNTGLFIAPVGRASEAVIHFDGQNWNREEIVVPPGASGQFRVFAIDATGAGNAWALAEDPALPNSVILLQRNTTPQGPEWVERPLAGSPFALADVPASSIAQARGATGASQPLTVTTDGVWIDLEAQIGGVGRSVTLFANQGGVIQGSWCDSSPCAFPLGATFSKQAGYRSFAWPGPGFGTRIVTNPLTSGGGEDTSRGTYLSLEGSAFARLPGGGANFRASGAFASPGQGWLEGPFEVDAQPPQDPLRTWPVSLRAPLTDLAAQPGTTPGAVAAQALAVGSDGGVLRYEPGRGWVREFLLTSVGAVNKASLRGVAWPEADRAHAVGDLGAMWMWNAHDDRWVADPGVPIGFEGNLLDVEFAPGQPNRGFAVGRSGLILEYSKSWDPVSAPSGFAGAELSSIAFAGNEALIAAGKGILKNTGGAWQVDQSAASLLASAPGEPVIYTVAALPDGGAVAAGRDVVLVRDGPGTPWRYSNQPIPGQTAVAAAATRPSPGGPVRPIISVVSQVNYPPPDDLPDPDPNVPPPVPPPFSIAGDGYLLRETPNGWEDQQRTAFSGASSDRPLKSDPALALLLSPSGTGWAVGGWSGQADAAGRGTSTGGSSATAVRNRVRTAMVARYGDGAAPVAAGSSPIPMPAGPVRLAVAGHAQCEGPCVDLAPHGIGPDRTLVATLNRVAGLGGGQGPRALLYTGGRVATGLDDREAARYAELLGSSPGLPVYPALGANDALGGGPGAFQGAFAGFAAPFGGGGAPAGVDVSGIPGAAPGPGARTHYAFDSTGPGGEVRVVVIDNSLGSLAASDAHQNPAEAQLPWLNDVLADARQEGVPAIVMGSRSLSPTFTPSLNAASDGTQVAQALVAGGASAYVFDRPEENRIIRVPSGAASTIPSFGTGTLGYRSPTAGVVGANRPDALFGDTGFLMLEVNAAARDAATNQAPVTVRQIPVLSDLALESTDGTLLKRSKPALFRGLGRRPLAGDRWGRPSAGSGSPDPSGGDPYTLFPPEPCLVAGCTTRIAPEYRFSSSAPDIADFVRQDPASNNLRKPFLDAADKVVTDNASGLLCPFNAGTATLTIETGGLVFSEQVTVLAGSVQRPCGTRPLDPSRFPAPKAAVPPPPATSPGGGPGSAPPVPPPPAAAAPAPPPTPSQPLPPTPLLATPLLPRDQATRVPFAPLTPPAPIGRPIPPGGAPARVYQVEEEEEEEAAFEETQAFARLQEPAGRQFPTLQLLIVVLAAALAGAARGGGGRPERIIEAAPAFNRGFPTTRRTG